MYEALQGLQPERVFYHFGKLSEIPRGSTNEKAVSDYIAAFCRARALEVDQDENWNLIIKKPATKGYESAPVTILQAHLDMVCEKNMSTAHDFLKDPVPVRRDGDRIYADGTTLGADNGTGLALALSILEADDIPHPALEVVFTSNEEAGMSGIKTLDFSKISGKVIVNLDCSDQGIVVGCAGTIQTGLSLPMEQGTVQPGQAAATIRVTGLKGGHSGLDIGKERGNAIILLARILADLSAKWEIRVADILGGMQANAIPRECACTILYPAEQTEQLKAAIASWNAIFSKEWRITDGGVSVSVQTDGEVVNQAGSAAFTQKLISLLLLLPSGVITRNMEIEGLVETSCNIGTIRCEDGVCSTMALCRSGLDSKKRYVAEATRRCADLVGAAFEVHSDSPEWEYKTDSRLRALIERVYKEKYGRDILVEVSHGGNECGTFFRKIPGADIVCTGTWIQGAHTPDESVGVAVIQQEWEMLKGTLGGMLSY